jgi:excisionase family DNA binding protein
MNDDYVFTPKELAAYMKVSLNTVYRNAEKLGGIRVGGSVRFLKSRLLSLPAGSNIPSDTHLGGPSCQSDKTQKMGTGTSISPMRMERELNALLGRKTAKPPKNSTTDLNLIHGGKAI